MSLKSLNAINHLTDPLRMFQVKFTISMAPALSVAKAQQKVAGLISGNSAFVKNSEVLELRCTSFTYPGTKVKQSSMNIAGFRRKLAAQQDKSGTWDCVITEDQDGAVLNTIQSWCDLMHNPLTGLRLSSALYVSTCLVQIENANDKDASLYNRGRTLWLKGFYPIEYSVSEIDASGSQPVEVRVKFNYDWWTETITSVSVLGAI